MVFFNLLGGQWVTCIVDEFSITSVGSTEAADLAVLTRPNCSLSETGRLLFFCVMSLLSLAVAVSFAFAGAWLVFPFAGLEVFGLGWALYYVSCHTGDYECIVVSGDDVVVETRSYKVIQQVKLQRHWVQVVVNARLGRCRVWLRACGKEVEVGRFFDDDGRLKLSQQIEEHTGAGYR